MRFQKLLKTVPAGQAVQCDAKQEKEEKEEYCLLCKKKKKKEKENEKNGSWINRDATNWLMDPVETNAKGHCVFAQFTSPSCGLTTNSPKYTT